jgi:transcriptional regulator with XRE-family HTH domain
MATRHPERYRTLLLRLREARKAAGMSQEEVAAALGARQKYISKIETGERRIDPLELQELAELYGKPIQFFLEVESPSGSFS